MIKFWLIINIFVNGQLVEKHQIRYKNATSCYLAMDSYPAKPGTILQADCLAGVEGAH